MNNKVMEMSLVIHKDIVLMALTASLVSLK